MSTLDEMRIEELEETNRRLMERLDSARRTIASLERSKLRVAKILGVKEDITYNLQIDRVVETSEGKVVWVNL